MKREQAKQKTTSSNNNNNNIDVKSIERRKKTQKKLSDQAKPERWI